MTANIHGNGACQTTSSAVTPQASIDKHGVENHWTGQATGSPAAPDLSLGRLTSPPSLPKIRLEHAAQDATGKGHPTPSFPPIPHNNLKLPRGAENMTRMFSDLTISSFSAAPLHPQAEMQAYKTLLMTRSKSESSVETFAGVNSQGLTQGKSDISLTDPRHTQPFNLKNITHYKGQHKWIDIRQQTGEFDDSNKPIYQRALYVFAGADTYHAAMARHVTGIHAADPQYEKKMNNLNVRGGFINFVGKTILMDGASGGITTPLDQVKQTIAHYAEQGILPEGIRTLNLPSKN